MKTIFRSAKAVTEKTLAPVTARPLLSYSLQLVLAVALYAAGIAVVATASGESRIAVVLFAVYFLPAVLRAWLQVYWRLRDGVKRLAAPRRRTGKAL
ncbi:hypothetical protein [Alloalcanivorax mobilis]|uniref:hypothetical protein n=1 Tax=Alloalcanivorax mobilis TaxID=2019569 RepID=UPI000B5B3F95|nr:hypothetical protein [Alloalcanivorax mobilis]ASK35230.1 hypothetical protein CEK62_12990 [Alcanivorax sp. N3-2A]